MAALTWGEYKTVIKRTILKDASGVIATNEKLADAARWAFNALCVHTPLMKSTNFTGDGNTYQFELPTDVYRPLNEAGLVIWDDQTNESVPRYLQPAFSTFKIAPNAPDSFSCWPTGYLQTGVPVPVDVKLIVRYYAYYPYMSADNDVMPIPEWAYTAVAYDIGIHLCTARSWEEANNAANKTDEKGTPDDNSLRQLQKWWLQMYEREIARHPKIELIKSPRA